MPAVFSRSPLQKGARQIVSAAYLAQPPIPSQRPVCPQLAEALVAQIPWGSGSFTAIGQQVPIRPLWSQLTQAPVHATLQQNPSAQKFDAHCEPAVQTAPTGLGPQLPFTHLTPPAQSLSDAQVATQAFVLGSQPNGAQMVAGPEVQEPWPSQTRVFLTAAPSQVPGAQVVPARVLRQAPLPSQVPSSPQLETSEIGQLAARRGATPAGTSPQTPGEPGVLQALQVSVQALLQQRPSTQKPLAQSPGQAQARPFTPCLEFAPLHTTTGTSTNASVPGAGE